MKIVILGGGNIGSLLIGDLGSNKKNQVYLYTKSSTNWNTDISVYNKKNEFLYKGRLYEASDNKQTIFSNASLIISTLPSHVFPSVLKEIQDYIPQESILLMIPGSGGGEYICSSLIKKKCIIAGLQRVHGIARIKEKGKSVYSLGKKDKLYVSTLSKKNHTYVTNLVENLFGIETICLDNYLNITLTPSNPILHTTRLYTLFPKVFDYFAKEQPLFYEEWTDESSKILFACDNELQDVCKEIYKYGIDLSSVVSLPIYYEAKTINDFTKKIISINAFKGIGAPVKEQGEYYIPDLNSRYFQEDFLFGLAIIKSCATLFDVKTDYIDLVLKWYEDIFNLKLYTKKGFCPTNEYNLTLPHLYFKKKQDFIDFYKS